MPSININGRLKRLEKQAPPKIEEIDKVIDRVTYETPVWFAFMNQLKGKATQKEKDLINNFWKDANWEGAKFALDNYWPRSIWVPVYLDKLYQNQGYKDYLDFSAAEMWFMVSYPSKMAHLLIEVFSGNEVKKKRDEIYGRFIELSEDEQIKWRKLSRLDRDHRYVHDTHYPDVKILVERFKEVYRKIALE